MDANLSCSLSASLTRPPQLHWTRPPQPAPPTHAPISIPCWVAHAHPLLGCACTPRLPWAHPDARQPLICSLKMLFVPTRIAEHESSVAALGVAASTGPSAHALHCIYFLHLHVESGPSSYVLIRLSFPLPRVLLLASPLRYPSRLFSHFAADVLDVSVDVSVDVLCVFINRGRHGSRLHLSMRSSASTTNSKTIAPSIYLARTNSLWRNLSRMYWSA
jgi:hypothetical protein